MRRKALLVFGFLLLLFAAKTENLAQAAEDLTVDTIKRVLRVTEQENNGFVEHVVRLMNENHLSRKNVTIAFLKAKRRTRHKFQYFKAAMIRLAAREGVRLT
ncbi:MAG: hypothetical protein JW888_09505 [Pirellulales bacterium]|nr:hypothetical protein [Pirellulales bacterium]